MTTPAEDFLFEAEPAIFLVRDYLIALSSALSGKGPFDERKAAALYRLADVALDEITSLERDFTEAFNATRE